MGEPTIYDVVATLEIIAKSKDLDNTANLAIELLARIYRYNRIENEPTGA